MALRHVKIVGSGLIGSSIGLALRAAEVEVTMIDINPASEALAVDLMGGRAADIPVDLIVVASPVSTVSQVIEGENRINPYSRFMDISSVKGKPKEEVKSLGVDLARFLPSHPMAGREVGGAESARGDLFQERAWIVDPEGVDSHLLSLGSELIALCGAHRVDISVELHDQAVALISHLPQIFSSLLASQLNGAPAQWLELAGSGLRDTTRIAASNSALWREILTANAEALKPLLRRAISDLTSLEENIEDPEYLENFINAGRKGRSLIPGKHGGQPRNYTYLPVVIEDKPGQLAALFDECAEANVNVEDLSIEHSPEQFTGLVTLALSLSDAEKLYQHLKKSGWNAHSPRF